jgi:hypothetical protein
MQSLNVNLYISLNEHNSKHKLNGQRIRVYTDHLNLTNDNFNTERVMRWHLILQQYSRTLLYIYKSKEEKNILSLITMVYMTVIYRMRYIRYYIKIYI